MYLTFWNVPWNMRSNGGRNKSSKLLFFEDKLDPVIISSCRPVKIMELLK